MHLFAAGNLAQAQTESFALTILFWVLYRLIMLIIRIIIMVFYL